jgi:D-glycero-alpha-D-manno-heptose 1-phosphate guanylyltransferase
MEAIILAGGTGTRLQSVVKDVPKPMADINGRPFLCYVLDYLSLNNVNKVFLSVGYKYEIIKNYFGLRYKNIDIDYIIEDKPLGTGGAIKKALRKTEKDRIIILNGDTFFNVDLRRMAEFHLAKNSLLTIAAKPMQNFDRYGTIVLKDERIVGFKEKSFKDFGYINGGIYIIEKKIGDCFSDKQDPFSFEVDFMHKKINDISAFAFMSDGYFIDIGVPEDYKKARNELNTVLKGVAG